MYMYMYMYIFTYMYTYVKLPNIQYNIIYHTNLHVPFAVQLHHVASCCINISHSHAHTHVCVYIYINTYIDIPRAKVHYTIDFAPQYIVMILVMGQSQYQKTIPLAVHLGSFYIMLPSG